MAYPEFREPKPDWIPDETFVVAMKTKDEYSILCPASSLRRPSRMPPDSAS